MTNAKGVLEWMEWKEKRERNMTNEEWLRSCTTEELAECLTNISFNTGYDSYNVVLRKIVEWLKQPHHESVTNCNE